MDLLYKWIFIQFYLLFVERTKKPLSAAYVNTEIEKLWKVRTVYNC